MEDSVHEYLCKMFLSYVYALIVSTTLIFRFQISKRTLSIYSICKILVVMQLIPVRKIGCSVTSFSIQSCCSCYATHV